MFSIGLHCRLVGRAGRIAALKRFIEYVQGHDKVWIARRIDIARHWAQENPYVEPKLVPSELDEASFVRIFGECFRNGATLAKRAFDGELGPANDSPYGLFFALRTQFRASSEAEKLEVLKGYTPLNPRIEAARIVEDESQAESLDAMTARQKSRLLELLEAYSRRFGFDAIFVVRNYTTAQLLTSLEQRILADQETELAVTYGEVEKLAESQVEARFAAQ